MSAQRLRRWSNIVQMLYKCFVFAGRGYFHSATSKKTQVFGLMCGFNIGHPALSQCWSNVADGGPTLIEHWMNV